MEAAATDARPSIGYARLRWQKVSAWLLALIAFGAITTVYRLSTLSSAFPSSWRLSIGDGFEYLSNESLERVPWAFDWTRIGVGFLLRWDSTILTYPPWPALGIVFLIVAYRAAGIWVAAGTLAAIMFSLGVGLWTETLQSLSLITISVVFSIAIGLVLGILTARSDRLFSVLRPLFDGMQTIPVFVYLIPALFAFGTGDPPSAIVTI